MIGGKCLERIWTFLKLAKFSLVTVSSFEKSGKDLSSKRETFLQRAFKSVLDGSDLKKKI